MTGPREAQLLQAANLFLDARRTLTPIEDLPEDLQPASMEEVYFVQDQIATALGPIGGWKVGAGSLQAIPIAAPLPAAWIAPSGSLLSAAGHRFRGLEAEIAFLLNADLPPRETPYTDEQVYAAVASCHPAIEVLESGLLDPVNATDKLIQFADIQMHGGLIYGPAIPDWQAVNFHLEHVTLAVDGVVRVEATGSNTSGDLLRLLPWLANAGSSRTTGLRAGQWITTGSWTGATTTNADSTVDVHFRSASPVSLRFE